MDMSGKHVRVLYQLTHHLGKDRKISRKGFGCAFGVVNAHRHACKACQGKTHSHAMIVVGVDTGVGCESFKRLNRQPIRPFFHLGAQFAQLGSHGGYAVRLFYPPTGDVIQAAGAVAKQRHYGQGHGGVGYVVKVAVEGFEWLAFRQARLHPVITVVNLYTDVLEGFGKGYIALNAVLPTPITRTGPPPRAPAARK